MPLASVSWLRLRVIDVNGAVIVTSMRPVFANKGAGIDVACAAQEKDSRNNNETQCVQEIIGDDNSRIWVYFTRNEVMDGCETEP